MAPGAKSINVESSNNPYDWLGTGAYFFEDDWMRALYFAQAASEKPVLSKGHIVTPAVVGVLLRIHRWLDLCTSEGREEYLVAYADLQAKGIRFKTNGPGKGEPGNDDILRLLDRQIINHIHVSRGESELPPYDAVRSYFPQGNSLAESSAFSADTHIQIALRDESCVLGYFRVRQAEVRIT